MDISSIIGSLSLGLFLTLIYISSTEKPRNDKNGNLILRASMVYTIIGALASITSFGILIFGLFFHQNDEPFFVILFFLIVATMGIPLFLYGINSKLIFNKGQIECTNMIGKVTIIKWDSIRSISFGRISLLLKIKSNNQTINIHQHMIGFNDLVNAIESNTNYTKLSMGVPFLK